MSDILQQASRVGGGGRWSGANSPHIATLPGSGHGAGREVAFPPLCSDPHINFELFCENLPRWIITNVKFVNRRAWHEIQCCGSGSAWVRINLKGTIQIHRNNKLDPDPHQFADDKPKWNGIWAYLSTFSRFWAFIWKLGSGSASKWEVESGSGYPTKWQAGSGADPEHCAWYVP